MADKARESPLKRTLINLVPPATLVFVVLSWMLLPRSITESEWSLVVASAAITFFVLGLEQVLERHKSWRLNRKEFATDLFYVILMATAISWAAQTFADQPLVSLKESLGIATPWVLAMPFLLQVALVVFLIEFGQYWMHRLMHDWYPAWLTHAPHHHITQLNAMKGAVGNPIELFLISLSVIALFDFDTVALFCGINVLSVISVFAHANVRSDPPVFYSYVFTTIRHHSLHHTALSYEDTRCNYGNSLILLDRIFGTYREGESEIVGQDERRRLTIYEQFLFPFQPLIQKYNAKRSKSASADT
ncbi:fatty acid hydroxylase family protein [Altererythrobacter aestuarii]|uniref:Fatty acid hydroxylase family protein n=2 Tax=Alteraurantiacibacter aestuarii TaxID=650004 RepID=A0A844ZM70_9SPHN|nr:sterol desaturase family protein [Alteraurantiacibacter aestuarii]MXO88150.1 fatty acid hydroxylase family protein [Alteraurantiacibacter aestuarii]